MTWNNKVTERLKIKYPIIQAPMLGVSTPEMAAAVSNEGGIGSLAVGGLSPEITQQLIRKTKSLTNKPFAVNLFVHDVPSYKEMELEPMRKFILHLAKKRGYQLKEEDLTSFKFFTYHDQIEVLLEEKISIISFTFGCLDQKSINLLKKNEAFLIGTATCIEEAIYLQEQSIDMITVQGIEAGGHRGTFMNHTPLPEIGLFSLLPQINEVVSVPCIAAGGINTGRTIKAALQLGAVAVQIGTAFIPTEESSAISSYKEKLLLAKDTDTTLTRAFSGRWARGIRNEMMMEIEDSGIPILPYPLQNSLTTKLRKLAQDNNDPNYTTLWSGQSVPLSKLKQSKEVFLDLVRQCEEIK